MSRADRDRRGEDWQAVRSREISRAGDDVRALCRTHLTDDWRPDWPTDRSAPHIPIDASHRSRASQHSCEEALADSLSRIAAFDGELMAFVRLDRERAQADAVEQDRRARQGMGVGPLHGFTVGIKDLIDTENVVTACGSPILVDRVAARDAAVVARLRAAGAIVVGKTVTTEFATFDPPPTRNPWNQRHTPGGSSAGSAAAVAAGMVRGALGTQTAGSVIRPAAYCGVVGYVPSPGLISRRGIYPCSWSLDRVGLFARSVDDVASMAAALVEADLRCPTPRSAASGRADELAPPRVGVLTSMFERGNRGAAQKVVSVAKRLAAQGWLVQDVDPWPYFEVGFPAHATIMRAEMATVHSDMYRRDRRRYAPRVASIIEAGLRIGAADYLRAQQLRRGYRFAMAKVLNQVDALLLPSATGPAERGHASIGDPVMSIPATFGGLPAITLPAGLSPGGLPLGVQLIGGRYQDAYLVQIARRLEQILAFDGLTLVARWTP